MLRGPPDPHPRGAPSPQGPRLYRGLELEALRTRPGSEEEQRWRLVGRLLSEALRGWRDLEAGDEPLSDQWLRQLKRFITTLSMLIAFVLLALMLMVVTRTSVLDASLGLEPCPEGWMYFRNTCFFFSDVAKSWEASQADCLSQEASLAVITNEETLNFIINRMDTHTFWVGLRKMGESLIWMNGESYTGNLLGAEAAAECAFVQSPSIALSRCDLPRNWICTKEPYQP